MSLNCVDDDDYEMGLEMLWLIKVTYSILIFIIECLKLMIVFQFQIILFPKIFLTFYKSLKWVRRRRRSSSNSYTEHKFAELIHDLAQNDAYADLPAEFEMKRMQMKDR